MDEIEIEILQLKFVESRLECFLCRFVTGIVDPYLGCHEEMLAIDSAFLDPCTDRFLIWYTWAVSISR